ncbi:monoamine oxidase [Larkinella arboricola]|uniref:Monoamine oxidase n=1 Tax=Larkinella arboricola TaxID=643671 RepID=A0A327WG16_LARAB|nr:NAD(P)/FAD-dependent oxidoreductase [Larkinella arboricola]RAJ89868.1 monoamine oxidase [Larkinella arboricola]
MKPSDKIIILGGGLSGLSLAYYLRNKPFNVTILEASPRLGGRIHTVAGLLETPLELGATWFSARHPNLLTLVAELGLTTFPQFAEGVSLFQSKSFEPPQKFFIPASEDPSYRLAGGTGQLIEALAKQLDPSSIHLDTEVTGIQEVQQGVVIQTANGRTYQANQVVSCIPLPVMASKVNVTPELPLEVGELLPTVQTWMGGSIKFAVEYATAFWRSNGYSGMLYSQADIVIEMYDHTSADGQRFGFTGFLSPGSVSFTQEVRKELVLRQLGELFGPEALSATTYVDKVWNDKFLVAGNAVIHRPHQNNGHPLLQQSYLNGKLYFGGTETARESPGYMEGAVVAAKRLALKLKVGN